jgi:hypothetical protein
MKNIVLSMSLVAVVGFMSACSSNTVNVPSSISVNAPKLHPEGISYHDKHFYLSSIYEGKIVTVDFEGKVKEFAKDASLVSVIGMHVDKKNGTLVVCNSDSGFGKKSSDATKGRLAELITYDLKSGKKLRTVSLSSLYQGGHFANDFTFDGEGNIYVTDSFSPVIYKVDWKGTATLFASSELFSAPQGSFGLNGIVYHDNHLIVGRADVGKLYKVSLVDPTKIEEVVVEGKVNSIDGLLLQKDGSLIVVSNNFTGEGFSEAVYKLRSRDAWRTASIVGEQKTEGGVFPTTVTEVDGAVYVNYSYLPSLVMKKPEVQVFKIQKIDFR